MSYEPLRVCWFATTHPAIVEVDLSGRASSSVQVDDRAVTPEDVFAVDDRRFGQ